MNELGMSRLRGVLRRRRIAVVATIVGALGVAAATIWQIEPGYKATAVIRAIEAQPAREYVAPTVAEQMGERLKSLRLSVMARPIVTQAARELDVFRAWPRKTADEVIDAMRTRMDVKLEGEDTFVLSYADPSPERAQAVVNRIATIFMKQQTDHRQQIASATVAALKSEVDKLKPLLEQADEAVRKFKLEHTGALPEQLEGNLRTLDQTTMEINIQSTNLDMENERRRQLLLAALSPLRRHEEAMAARLYEARIRYTEGHPEVENIRDEYEKVRGQRIADEKDLTRKVRRDNPELASLDGQIDRTRAMLGGLRDRQAQFRKRVDATAKNGQELAALALTYDGLKDKYSSTLRNQRDAELAQNLERNLASVRFDLVEGASVPINAASPNRPLIAVAALVLALVLGLGVGFALEATDNTLRDAGDLRLLAPATPILACVPKATNGIFKMKPNSQQQPTKEI